VKLAAVRCEINKISQLILKEHLDHCILDAMETHDHEAIEKLNEAIDKLMR
jgi:DNA-binding FrmR family transcriptional regulator